MEENKKLVLPNVNEAFTMPLNELVVLLDRACRIEIPDFVTDPVLLPRAGALLARCSSLYSYLASYALKAKLRKRELKRKGVDKQILDDAMSREDIFNLYADCVKQTYSALSRMITIKAQINDELKLSGATA